MTSVCEKEVGARGLLALLLQLPLNPSVGRAHSAYSQRNRGERMATDVRLTLLCGDVLTSLFPVRTVLRNVACESRQPWVHLFVLALISENVLVILIAEIAPL